MEVNGGNRERDKGEERAVTATEKHREIGRERTDWERGRTTKTASYSDPIN